MFSSGSLLPSSVYKWGANRRISPPKGEILSKKRSSSTDQVLSSSATSTSAASWVVTEDRRRELLEAAQNKRIAWIEGVDEDHAALRNLATEANVNVTDAGKVLGFLDRLATNDIASSSSTSSSSTKFEQSHKRIYNEISSRNKIFSASSLRDDENHNINSNSDSSEQFYAAYQEFCGLLKDASANDIVNEISSFESYFNSLNLVPLYALRNPTEQPGGIVHTFIAKIANALITTLLNDGYPTLSSSPELVREVLETFLMEKLYSHATESLDKTLSDESLHRRIESLSSFINMTHLDIPSIYQEEPDLAIRWTEIGKTFSEINTYLSPRQKMECLLQVCSDLTSLLQDGSSTGAPSADEFLPAMIFVILSSNPPYLNRTLQYISQYRHPSRLLSEPGYFFTHLASAISFLETLDHTSLTITREEFEAGFYPKISSSISNDVVQEEEVVEESLVPPPPPSLFEIRNERLRQQLSEKPELVFKEDVHHQQTARFSLQDCGKFVNMNHQDLRVLDLPMLLEEYKWLYSEVLRLSDKNSPDRRDSLIQRLKRKASRS